MSEEQIKDIRVRMLRDDLDDVPQYGLPEGYAVRLFRPGDEKAWERIWIASDAHHAVDPERLWRAFHGDLDALERRCMFLVSPQGLEVGTVTAWYAPRYRSRRWGMIHYVAIAPQHQGRGLAKGMLSAAMNKLRELGHRRALLNTESRRLRAISVYLDFGFRPDMTRPNAEPAWKIVSEQLDRGLPLTRGSSSGGGMLHCAGPGGTALRVEPREQEKVKRNR